jgi:hypothetical protein
MLYGGYQSWSGEYDETVREQIGLAMGELPEPPEVTFR